MVIAADSEHPAVEVLALHLDHGEIAAQHVGFGATELLEAGEVDGHGDPRRTRGTFGEIDDRGVGLDSEVGAFVHGEQLVDRHRIEPRQSLQSGHRDGALAAFVGTQHGGLELLTGLGLDLLERQPLLAPNGAKSLADLAAVCVRSYRWIFVVRVDHEVQPLPADVMRQRA
ncbi:unannotated protein [freshwater metagenome]|uniref:Unannotated protein n=1 Tax=freshwater metagenome TaxID=449393 RepID=A0A6J7J0Z1_9ZZZZ